ncbi:MAG: hypothetical protein MMC33_008218 [Icmadophila ericetorum]|nr:hypothetical protein [Icmadophila ericetorum]
MTSSSAPTDNANFWNVNHSTEDAYWEAYIATRPSYSSSNFLSLIYTYHSQRSTPPSFTLAHDVGCGAGMVAEALASRFDHVVASDKNLSSLDVARRRLSAPSLHISFSHVSGEELSTQYEPASADLIAVAECIPLMDDRIALASFAQVLKPGGTLAVWIYTRPHFSEPAYKEKCQPLLDEIMDHSFAKVIKGGPPERTASWKRAAEGLMSWLDYLDFGTDQWERIQRWKWNSKSTQMRFFGPDACDFEIEARSRVRLEEELIEKEDPELWKGNWNVKGVRDFVNASFPDMEAMVKADPEIQNLFSRLAKEMGGEDAIRTYTWPLALILATRVKC